MLVSSLTVCLTSLALLCSAAPSTPKVAKPKKTSYVATYDDIPKFPGIPKVALATGYKDLVYKNFEVQSTPKCPLTPSSGKYALVSPLVSAKKTSSIAKKATASPKATFDLQEIYFGCAALAHNKSSSEFCFLKIFGTKLDKTTVNQMCAFEASGTSMENCEFIGSKWQGLTNVTFAADSVPGNSVVVLDSVKYVYHP